MLNCEVFALLTCRLTIRSNESATLSSAVVASSSHHERNQRYSTTSSGSSTQHTVLQGKARDCKGASEIKTGRNVYRLRLPNGRVSGGTAAAMTHVILQTLSFDVLSLTRRRTMGGSALCQ